MTLLGSDGTHGIAVFDTIKTIPPPDSIMVTVTTYRGDHEEFWLHSYGPSTFFPGTMGYRRRISSESSHIPVRDDGILQIYDRGPDYHKVSYRSYNDNRVYSLRLEWFQDLPPGGWE